MSRKLFSFISSDELNHLNMKISENKVLFFIGILFTIYFGTTWSVYPLTDASNFFNTNYTAVDSILCLSIVGMALTLSLIAIHDAKRVKLILAKQVAILPFVVILFFRYKVDVEHSYVLENLIACVSIFFGVFILAVRLKVS
jgi:hypothetical protein